MVDNRKKLNSKHLISIMLLTTLIIVLISFEQGNQQNRIFLEDIIKLSKAQQFITEGKLEEAKSVYLDLEKKYPNSYPLTWNYAECLSMQGDYISAIKYFKKTQEINPSIIRDSRYLIQISDSLYNTGDYKECIRYLNIAELMNLDENEKAFIAQVLIDIEKKIYGDNYYEN